MNVLYLKISIATSVLIKHQNCEERYREKIDRICRDNELIAGICSGPACTWNFKCCQLEAHPVHNYSPSQFFLQPIGSMDVYAGSGGANNYCGEPDTVAFGVCVSSKNWCAQYKRTDIRCHEYSKVRLNYEDCEPHYAVNQSIPMHCGDGKFAVQYCRATGTATINCGIDYLGPMTEGYITSIDGSSFTRFTNSYMTNTLGYFPMTSMLCCSLRAGFVGQ